MLVIFQRGFLLLALLFLASWGKEMNGFAQTQDFESNFSTVSFPEEFLPGWWGNEVRSTSSRIFQLSGQGRNGSRALAVQPISTFDGAIWIRLFPDTEKTNQVSFWAKSLQNGSGNRPAEVQLSWSASLNGDYADEEWVGDALSFPNATTAFTKYSFSPPQSLAGLPEIFLKIKVKYGAGSGSAARWVMDDFEFGELLLDETPPSINSVLGYASRELLIQFDEAVDPVFSKLPLAYTLEGENPDEIMALTDSSLLLKYEQVLEEGKTYRLGITQIPDLAGNFLKDTVVIFTFFDPSNFAYKSVVINELMPAPRANQDLPNVEYIEIFNSEEKALRLGGLMLSNSRSESVLEEKWVDPKSHLILCPPGASAQLEAFGEVLEVNPWPTMLNSGDVISIRTSAGELVDQLSYQTSTWGGSEFAQGGYSLEVPNPANQCDNSGLLSPSRDPLRGTPGQINSVFRELDAGQNLALEQIFFRDSLQMILQFNQPLPPSFGRETISISPSLEIDTVAYSEANRWVIRLREPAQFGQLYEVSLVDFQDCAGNRFEQIGLWDLVYARKALAGDLELNEILFNPRTGDPKFVEVANLRDEYLDLSGWALSNGNQERIFGAEGLIIFPAGFLAITTDTAALRLAYPKSSAGKFFQLPSLPSYPIGGGRVILIDTEAREVDSFAYSEDFHHPIIRDPKGVSLERLRVGSAHSGSEIWVSASASEDYATPGRRNSQEFSGDPVDSWLQIDPEVFDPEGTQGPSFTTFRYRLPSAGWVGSLSIYNSMGGVVTSLAQNQILGAEGIFTWNGTQPAGGRMAPGIYVVVFELWDLDGRSRLIKKTVVVGARL